MTTPRSGVVLVMCAPSGTGKTTLIQKLLQEFPHFGFSISCTTREPREGEIDGKDYHFISEENFKAQRDVGYFAEWAYVHGNYYGTPLAPALDMLHKGQDIIFDVDVQGAAQLHLTLPSALCLFILPPSLDALRERLEKRGTDNVASMAQRLQNAAHEIRQAHWFHAWIVNDSLEDAYDQVRAAYLAATLHPQNRPLLLRSILGES